VAPDSFGLSVEEILALEDRELNQVVGLKKLAPYRCGPLWVFCCVCVCWGGGGGAAPPLAQSF
jgi:hypothetical protein